jgi:RHS repeat-associated protein
MVDFRDSLVARRISLTLIFTILLELIAPAAWALPERVERSAPNTRAVRSSSDPIDPQLAKVLSKIGHPAPDLPGNSEALGAWFPDPNRVAQADPEPSSTPTTEQDETPSAEPTASPTPRRYRVTEENLRAREAKKQAEEAEAKEKEQNESGDSPAAPPPAPQITKEDEPVVNIRHGDDSGESEGNDGIHVDHGQLAYLEVDPQASTPAAEWSRQTHASGRYYPLVDGNTAYVQDELVHLARDYKDLGPEEDIVWNWRSPVAQDNQTALNTAASVRWRLHSVGSSPSALDSQYTLEVTRYDRRSPSGRRVFSRSEPMQLCEIRLHAALAARSLGDWQLTTTRNGQAQPQETLHVVDAPIPTVDDWSRYRVGAYKAAADRVFYVNDEFATKKHTYPMPAPDSQGQQSFRVTWDWLAPASALLNHSKRHSYASLETSYLSDGTTWSIVSKTFDPSYPAGRVSTQTGTGRLPTLDVFYSKGLPTYGTWRLRESIRDGATTTEDLSVRQIKTSVSTDTPTLPVGGGEPEPGEEQETVVVPFHLKIETFPSSWTPEKLNWKLNLKGSNGQTRLYEGSIEESGQSSHSVVQVWNGGDNTGKKFALGVQVDPVLLVSIPEEQAPSALRAAVQQAPEASSYVPPYVVMSVGSVWNSSISTQYLHNGETVTYTATFCKYTNPSTGFIGNLCMLNFYQCPGSVSCTINGSPAPILGNGLWGLPQAVINDYYDPAQIRVMNFTVAAAFTLGPHLTPSYWPEGSSAEHYWSTGALGPMVGGISSRGFSDMHPVNIIGEAAGPPAEVAHDVEAGAENAAKDEEDKKVTAEICSCVDCNGNVIQNSPLKLNLASASGMYDREAVDLAVATRGYPLAISRENNSRQGAEEQPNGWNWGFRDSLIVDTAANVIYHRASNGKCDTFLLDGNLIRSSDEDLMEQMSRVDSRHFERVTKGHTRFIYEIPAGISLSDTEPVPAVLTKITDPNGNANTFSWDSLGQKLNKMEGPVPGQFIRLDWRSGHNGPLLKSAVDHTGRRVNYEYSATSNPISPSGYDDLLTEVVQPGHKSFSYAYHSVLGKRHYVLLTSRINGVLQEKAVECDSLHGVLLESTHRLGSTMKFDRTRNPDGSVVSHITHTALHGMPQNQDQSSTYHINANNMVTQMVDPEGNTSQFEYKDHNVVRQVDPRGHVSKSSFDDRQNLISSTDNLNRTTLLTYDAQDNVKTVQDVQGGVTTLGWDANNNLISVTDPAQHTSTITRNSLGQVISVTDALGHVTGPMTYDALGFLKSSQSAAAFPGAPPAITTFKNDTLGRPVEVRDTLGRVAKIRFDERNHPVETTLPAITASGAQQALPPAHAYQVFDVNDLLRESIAVDGAKTLYEYDSAHHLKSVQTPGNPVPTRLEYDAMENMVKLTTPSGASTYVFDCLNRNTELRYPGGDGETYQFDANSNLISWNRGSYAVTYTFDELDRLSVLDSPTTNDHIVLGYDPLDRVASMTDNSGTTTYGYTTNYLLDHVTRQTGTVSYGYDDADRLTTLTADGDVTNYRYDDRDRLTQATLDGQSVSYAYDQANRPTLMNLSNGVSCQQVFNERDGLLNKRYLRGGSPLFTAKYAYNQLGQRKLEEKRTANWTKNTKYAYNKRRELSDSYRRVNNDCTVETHYEFDLNHNRTKKNETRYHSNTNDQLTTVRNPAQSLAYNGAGQARQAGDSSFTFAYNDQIKTVNTGAHTAAYLYDGNGQRVQKNVDGVVSKFLWTGGEIVKEYTAAGAVKAQYFLGGGRTAIKHNGRWNFYLTDGLGSTVMLTDSSGHSVATWDYSDYGETTQLTGATSVYNPFLYTGQELDKETGFYHLRARHYAPSLGKFLSRDPIRYGGGSNLYSYCAGDPINSSDPSGLAPAAPDPKKKKKTCTVDQTLLLNGTKRFITFTFEVDLPDGATGARLTDPRWSPSGTNDPNSSPIRLTRPGGYGFYADDPVIGPRPIFDFANWTPEQLHGMQQGNPPIPWADFNFGATLEYTNSTGDVVQSENFIPSDRMETIHSGGFPIPFYGEGHDIWPI